MLVCAVRLQLISTPSRRLSSVTAGKGQTAGKPLWLMVLGQLVVWQRLQWDVVTASGGGRGGSNGGHGGAGGGPVVPTGLSGGDGGGQSSSNGERRSSDGGLGEGRGSLVLAVCNPLFTRTMYVLRWLGKSICFFFSTVLVFAHVQYYAYCK